MFRMVLGFLFLVTVSAPASAQGYSAEQAGRLRAAMAQFIVIAPVDARTGANLTQTLPASSGGKTVPAFYLDPDKCADDIRAAGAVEIMAGVPGSGAEALIGSAGDVAWLSEEADVFGAKVFFLVNSKGQELTIDVNGRTVIPYYVSAAEAAATQAIAQKALGSSETITVEPYALGAIIQQIESGATPNAYLVSPASMYAWAEAYGRGARLIAKEWQGAGN